MAPLSGIGVITVIENGETRFRPLEFVPVDGELWAATSANFGFSDGQHVEVLFFGDGYDLAQVQGVLRCSRRADDRQRLQANISGVLPSTHELIIKIVPHDAEVLPAIHPSVTRRAG